jgi:hypothetical protein
MELRRAWRGPAAAVFALCGLFAPGVGAAPHWQAVGESSLGYTDNAQASPRTAGQHTKSAFWMLSPGLTLALASPRNLQRLTYRFEYDFYFNSQASSSSANRLDYRGFFELSRRITLVLGGRATQSDRFNSVAFAAPGAGAVGALPVGAGSYLDAAADETMGFDVAESWRAWQSSSVLAATPLFDTEAPTTLSAGLRAGIERSFKFDAVGVEGRGDYTTVSDGVTVDGSPAELQQLLTGGGVARWRHDFGPYFSSSVEAGALRAERLNSQRGLSTPIGSASLFYVTEQGDAQLGYSHTLTTNALLGQSLLVDEVRLRGGLPLTDKGELSLNGSSAYQLGRLLDERAELATRVRVFLADISLGWQATKLLAVGVRYEHIRQKSGSDTPPLPVGFVQNNVLLGMVLKFPPERDMPRPYRSPQRVDRSDELRDGFQTTSEGPRGPGEGAR